MVCSLLMKLLLPHVFFAPFLVRANFISQNPSPRTAAWCSPRYMACAWGLHASPEHETSNSMLLLRAVSRGLELAPRKTSKTQVPLSQQAPQVPQPKIQAPPVGWFVLKCLCLILTFYSLSENPIISNSCVSRKDMNFV